MTAKQVFAAIKANVDAFYGDKIDHSTLCKRNAALWASCSPRVNAAVCTMWRAENPV